MFVFCTLPLFSVSAPLQTVPHPGSDRVVTTVARVTRVTRVTTVTRVTRVTTVTTVTTVIIVTTVTTVTTVRGLGGCRECGGDISKDVWRVNRVKNIETVKRRSVLRKGVGYLLQIEILGRYVCCWAAEHS